MTGTAEKAGVDTVELKGALHDAGDALYEAGSASDTLAQKLYNYSFRRIQLSAPEGDLTAVTFPLEPQLSLIHI